ncbi:hypothetical protein NEOLEDRAFT_1153539 [Neolentinus lepideus HHB14362 ss-1]|uniref:C2H2-type domain-containing protein n=1 Tax=Neolentinus lepideus HHB14362 ss-1 TaxID=1314782 RepID=A0A165VVV7_9AGAM|nr:hypothetical protein NEOLEDRAFT_1153539 [Neolentinus lepideus HHB14362 ss-1]
MSLACVPACGRVFQSRAALGIHRAACPHLAAPDPSFANLAAWLAEKRSRKQRHQDDVPAPIAVESTSGDVQDSLWLAETDCERVLTAELQIVTPSDPVEDTPPPAAQPTGRGARKKRPTWKILEQLPQPTLSLADLSDVPDPSGLSDQNVTRAVMAPIVPSTFAPFKNISQWRLMNWMWQGSHMKSLEELNRLVDEVICAPDFRKEDFVGFDARRETAKLDVALSGDPMVPSPVSDGWREVDVRIEVPDGKTHRQAADPPIPTFDVPGLHYCSLVEVLKSAWMGVKGGRFHLLPFKEFWSREGLRTQRVYGELYMSDAFNAAHEQLQAKPQELGCELERVICALMFWSDSTHLASFGNASLWPIYLFFGNQSKYSRGKPSTSSCEHVAYIPKLPDAFHDYFKSISGTSPTADVLTHCRREIMHAHGIILKGEDGVTRRVYPRIFTYSADYPEKILLATVRNLGTCPCPRCKIPKSKICELGMKRDDARCTNDARNDNPRDFIYIDGKGVKSTAVKGLLATESLVPTKNAFSEKLSSFSFNLFSMLVVDLMHEFELGVWKVVFTHLIRILYAHGGDAIQMLNERFRLVATFGHGTIRRFSNNASAMKKLAARDFEDLLQCSLPVFEGLLAEPYDKHVQELLFALAEWHAGAKLRIHTEQTLEDLQSATTHLGARLRHFVKYTCPSFDTKELPREEAARVRRQQKRQANTNMVGNRTPGGRKRKLFNLSTYKCHALGDYPRQIRVFRTSDSYSTQTGEMEHKSVKSWYARTNKNNATRQITLLQRHKQAMIQHSKDVPSHGKPPRRRGGVAVDGADPLPYTPPDVHHHISHSRNSPLYVLHWLSSNAEDPALTDFLPKLQDHLLERLEDPDVVTEGQQFSEDQRARLIIPNDRIFAHKTMHVNYTTYDVRREQDTINPQTHTDIMMLQIDPEENAHAFTYARVLGIFHADILHNVLGTLPAVKRMEFLYVRWFRFLPVDDPGAFTFVNPDDVIRGIHLIPGFAHGQSVVTDNAVFARGDVEKEWNYHYVNFFVDRDMYMRYKGGGIGHHPVRTAENDPDDRREAVIDEDDAASELQSDGYAVARDATEDIEEEEEDEEEEVSEEEVGEDENEDEKMDEEPDEEAMAGYAAL